MIMEDIKAKVTNPDALRKAYVAVTKGLLHKDTVIWSKHNILERVYFLYTSIIEGTYYISKYNKVAITFPKHREALATELKDRAFQRSLVDNYFYKELARHFIYENCACLKGKGTDFARELFKKQLVSARIKYNTNQIYALKCDIHHFFESIDHEVMEKLLTTYIRDTWARSEAMRVVNSFPQGLGLGSQISQLTASAYLSPMDHFIKEVLHIKYYVRYMDDFILLHNDKKYLQHCLEKLQYFLKTIKLTYNPQKTQIIALLKQKVTFLGFKFGYTKTGKVLIILPKTNIYIERRRLKHQMAFYYKKGVLTYNKIWQAFSSWVNHASKGNNWKVIKDMTEFFIKLCDQYHLIPKGENMENYICYRHYRGTDVTGKFNINLKFGSSIVRIDNLLYAHDLIICRANSADGHTYFCSNFDGNGIQRGEMIKKISLSLRKRYANALTSEDIKANQKWQKTLTAVVGDVIAQKYLKETDKIFWNDEYYRASIEDLEHIYKIIKNK